MWKCDGRAAESKLLKVPIKHCRLLFALVYLIKLPYEAGVLNISVAIIFCINLKFWMLTFFPAVNFLFHISKYFFFNSFERCSVEPLSGHFFTHWKWIFQKTMKYKSLKFSPFLGFLVSGLSFGTDTLKDLWVKNSVKNLKTKTLVQDFFQKTFSDVSEWYRVIL